jgi:hypothetical protein
VKDGSVRAAAREVFRTDVPGCVTDLHRNLHRNSRSPGLRPAWHHIVIINNGNRGWKERHTGMLGVPHQGIIPQPDPTARRMIHSFMLVLDLA